MFSILEDMKKVWLLMGATILLSGCSWSLRKSGVEIMSYPPAKVYVDGKEAGMTPYKNNSMKPGDTEIKLIANGEEWSKKIHLENGANTVISRDNGGGYILYFEPTGDKNRAAMLINTRPDKAAVAIDDEIKGFSPLRVEDVGEGDKKLVVSYPGYKSAISYVKFLNSYQLVVDVDLTKEKEVATPEVTPTETINEKEVMILNTETGWLRVRSAPSNGAQEVAKVKPGEKYKLLEDGTEWRLIELGIGKSGYVAAKYVEIL